MKNTKTTALKTAKYAGIAAVLIACPKCGDICTEENGSQMVAIGTERVPCAYCGEYFQLPTRAIKLLLNM